MYDDYDSMYKIGVYLRIFNFELGPNMDFSHVWYEMHVT